MTVCSLFTVCTYQSKRLVKEVIGLVASVGSATGGHMYFDVCGNEKILHPRNFCHKETGGQSGERLETRR